MLLFRSEGHIERWRAQRGISSGVVLTMEQLTSLARLWYGDRLDPDWRRKSPEAATEIFEGLGLTGPFWELV